MEKGILTRYLIDKKESIAGLEVVPRNVNIGKTKKFITPVIGPRRSGKTYYFFDLILNKLKIQSEDFIYMNFEDPELEGVGFKDILDAINIHEEVYGKKPEYIFFDEVHNVEGWEKVVRSLYETKKYYIFLTGSSSKLLSKEIATSLRGRTLTYLLFPLSFLEVLRFKKIELEKYYSTSEENKIKNSLRDYLKFGGFPDIVFERQFADRFFKEYLDLVIFRDVIERHKIKNVSVIKFLVKSLISSFSKEFSVHKMFNIFKSQGIKVSKKTLYNYLNYLEDSLFIFPLKKFSYSVKESELSIVKVFLNDMGIANSIGLGFSENIGKLMENAVFLQLKRRENENPKMEIFYYRFNDKEVDFLVKEGLDIKELIQVCYDIEDFDTRGRELDNLIKASEKIKCKNLLVVTWDYENVERYKGKIVRFVPLWKWLLGI